MSNHSTADLGGRDDANRSQPLGRNGDVSRDERDAGPLDAGPLDAGPFDAEALDAGPLDAGPFDAEALDAGLLDAEAFDAEAFDAEALEVEEAPAELRNRLILALDVDDVVEAIRLVHELKPWFGVAKVGLELFTSAGPDAVLSILAEGMKVFLDLKLFDIPTTVGKAGRVIGALGASYLTLAGFGGVPMLRAGVEGLANGASLAGLDPPMALAVTMLTSDTGAPEHVLGNRVRAALEANCGGVVCAATDAAEVKQLAPGFTVVVPGIRTEGSPRHDHGRAATPGEAFAAGADLLVVGRTVTAAPDRAAAASQLIGSIVS
ncbi:MAG: orotidine-5'-phosphate decarboxylase [Actinomycetota bacterium]|nr:orotidine-5'-phosphate decarboxylase [Actinomycetota bacterium]